MRAPRCSILLWSDLTYETSPPFWVRQSGTNPFAGTNNFMPQTVSSRSVFELINEATEQISGASGRDLPGGFRRPRARVRQAISFSETARVLVRQAISFSETARVLICSADR